MADDTRIELVRSGGLAGLSMGTAVRVGDLPPEKAAAVDSALRDVDLDALSLTRATREPAGADRFQYDIEVTEGDRRHRFSLGEADVPSELKPLLDALLPLAQPRP